MHNANNGENLQFDVGGGPEIRQPLEIKYFAGFPSMLLS